MEDAKRENQRQGEINTMLENQIADMHSRNDAMQNQVENSLSQSHENMGKIVKENKKLELQRE